jgi:hypothetical protein
MAEQEFTKVGTVNTEVLDAALKAAVASITGISTLPGLVKVISSAPLTAGEVTTVTGIIAAHDGSVLSEQQQIEAARAAVALFRVYLKDQLVRGSVDTAEQMVSFARPIIDANVFLTRAMQRWLFVLKTSEAWTPTVAVLMNPTGATTDENRTRYLRAVKDICDVLFGA